MNRFLPLFKTIDWCKRNASFPKVIAAIPIGICLGLFPVLSLQWCFSLLALLLVRVQPIALVFVLIPARLVLRVAEPHFDAWGTRLLLNTPSLNPFWTWMYHSPFIPFTGFYNTITMGNLSFTLTLAVSTTLIALALNLLFGDRVRHWVKNSRSRQRWLASRMRQLYGFYEKENAD